MKRIAWFAVVLLVVAFATAGAATAKKPHPVTSGHGKNKLTLVTAAASTLSGFECGNPYDMQADASLYTTICIECPTLPDGPGGDTVWVPALWAVVTERFDEDLGWLAYTYGCDTNAWYYWT